MKIKKCYKEFSEVQKISTPKHKNPKKPIFLLSTVMRLASSIDLKQVDFSFTKERMEDIEDKPCLILMNHSSFLDLEIVSAIMYPKKYNIVCTSDGFVGKEWLMRSLGCIPTQKFVSDFSLISDLKYALHTNKTSVLMYPEASYSFDGTTTPLPRKIGTLFKMLKVPVVMITTYGSFSRDPLYNNLQKRKVKVTAKMECLFTVDDLNKKKSSELESILDEAFKLDYFKWQYDNKIKIDENFRADGLNRILFRCPECKTEGKTEGKGVNLVCHACGKNYYLNEYGRLESEGDVKYPHIPDWYSWQRSEIINEINNGTYSLDTDVEIGIMKDYKSLYMVGEGKLHHGNEGFVLDGCDGQLHYEQNVLKCYSLYSDYFWYEIDDVICIGDSSCLYYCFPKKKDIVAKTRIAAEELYKKARRERSPKFENEKTEMA